MGRVACCPHSTKFVTVFTRLVNMREMLELVIFDVLETNQSGISFDFAPFVVGWPNQRCFGEGNMGDQVSFALRRLRRPNSNTLISISGGNLNWVGMVKSSFAP